MTPKPTSQVAALSHAKTELPFKPIASVLTSSTGERTLEGPDVWFTYAADWMRRRFDGRATDLAQAAAPCQD